MSYETNQGYRGALGLIKEAVLGTAKTAQTGTLKYLEIESETFGAPIGTAESKGITGSRSRSKHTIVQGKKDVRGGFVINGAKGADFDLLLELSLGNYASGTGYPKDILPSFTVVRYAPPIYDIFAGCKMSKFGLASSQDDQALKLTAEVVGMTRANGVQTDLGTPSYADEIPLTHMRSTFTVASESVRTKSFGLNVVNALDEEVYRNSQNRLALPENDLRSVDGEMMLDWNQDNIDHVLDLWEAWTFGELMAEYTNGVYVVTVVAPNCIFPSERAKIGGPGTLEEPVKFNAFASTPGASDEVYIYRRVV